MGYLGRIFNLLLCAICVISDILFNTSHEKSWLLTHQTKLVPQVVKIELFDVSSVDQNLSFGWFVKSE